MFLGKVPGNVGGWGRSPLGFLVVVRARVSGGAVQKGRQEGPQGQCHRGLSSETCRW